jgi:hypothetical protein
MTLLVGALCLFAAAGEIRTGVSAAPTLDGLPFPMRGYQAYLTGEMHGVAENAEFQLWYLAQLHHASGLRDIAIEERGVYEIDAQAFIDGRADALQPHLCLRAELLEGIRKLNAGLKPEERFRVHLTDIDSPAAAIRQHLTALQLRLGATGLRIPSESAIKDSALDTVAQLQRLNPDAATRSELRTVEFSVLCLRQGLEFDLGAPKGSPYLDSREEAVAGNIVDLIRTRGIASLLVVYGSDHVSRTPRKDGGPERNLPFQPMGLRLEKAGIKVFSVITNPLEGRTFWRGHENEIYGDASDGHLASGEKLDKVFASAPGSRFLYIDRQREHVRLPSEDVSKMAVDAFLLFRSGTAMKNACAR